MKVYKVEKVNLNGENRLLMTVEMPPSGILNMPRNGLGLFVGKDQNLYLPVNPLGKTAMGGGSVRDLVWHAIRNLQRNLKMENKVEALTKTRRLFLLHEMLLEEYDSKENITDALCQIQGLDLLLKILKEPRKCYLAKTEDTINIDGVPVDRKDLAVIFDEAGNWYLWESDLPDQRFRQGWLLGNAIESFYALYDIQGFSKHKAAQMIEQKVNVGHSEDTISLKEIKEVMDLMDIPACSDTQLAVQFGVSEVFMVELPKV